MPRNDYIERTAEFVAPVVILSFRHFTMRPLGPKGSGRQIAIVVGLLVATFVLTLLAETLG